MDKDDDSGLSAFWDTTPMALPSRSRASGAKKEETSEEKFRLGDFRSPDAQISATIGDLWDGQPTTPSCNPRPVTAMDITAKVPWPVLAGPFCLPSLSPVAEAVLLPAAVETEARLVYGLIDPETVSLRYVGKSRSGLVRPRDHLKKSELARNNYKNNWLRPLVERGRMPYVVVVGLYENDEALNAAERFYIADGRGRGLPLTNTCDGGDGRTGPMTEESKALMSAVRRGMAQPWKARPITAVVMGTGEVENYPGLKLAGEYSSTSILSAMSGEYAHYAGRQWYYTDELTPDLLKDVVAEVAAMEPPPHLNTNKPVLVVAVDVQSLAARSFQTISAASRALGVQIGGICACFRGDYGQAGGYYFLRFPSSMSGELARKGALLAVERLKWVKDLMAPSCVATTYYERPKTKAEKCREARLRQDFSTPELLAKRSELSKAMWQDPEYRKLQTEIIKERWQDPEYRAKVGEKISARQIGKKMRPESVEKMRQSKLGKKMSPEACAKMSAARLGSKRSSTAILKTAEKNKKAIVAVCPRTGAETPYRSSADACAENGYSQSGISASIKSKGTRKYKGLLWYRTSDWELSRGSGKAP